MYIETVVRIENVPDYAKEERYIVARHTDGYWFYGGYSNHNKACKVAEKLGNGVVFFNNGETFMNERGEAE